MTVSTTIRKAGPFAGTGLVSSYPFAFKVFTDDDLLVIRTPTGGADVTLVLASDYTVTLNPDQDAVPGGSVVLSAALAVGFTLSIGSQVDSLQGLSLTNNGGFFPKAIENALDKLDIQDQQQEETLSRAVRVPFGSGAIPDLPAPSAGSALVWNALGTALENGTPNVDYSALRSDLLGTGSGQGASQIGQFGGGTVQDTIDAVGTVALGTADADISTAIAAARSAGGGVVSLVEAGAYAPASTPELVGEFTNGVVLDGRRAVITSGSTTQDGIKIGNEVGSIASSYFNKYKVENLVLTGAGTGGTAAGLYHVAAADIQFDNIRARNWAIGAYIHGGLTSDYSGLCVRDNGVGIKAEFYNDGAGGLNDFAPNANTFYGLRNFYNGVAVQYLYNPSGCVNWIGSNFEANNSTSGTTTDGKKVFEVTSGGHHNLFGCHFESNLGEFGVHYTGFDSTKSLCIIGSELIDAVGTNLHMAVGRLTAVASRITNVSSPNDIVFAVGTRGTLIDTEGAISGSLDNVLCIRDGRIQFGGQPIPNDPPIKVLSAPIVASSNVAAIFRNDTVQIQFQNTAGTRSGYLQTSSTAEHTLNNDNAAGGWVFRANNSARMYIGRAGANSIEPAAANTIACGTATFPWSGGSTQVAFTVTSDERTKEQIEDIPQAWLNAWGEVKWQRYKLKDSVQQKGDGARWHVGLIAQRVKEAFERHGVDAFAIGLLCWDEWPAVYDTDGALVQPAGEKYAIRYEEALSLECAYLRSKLADGGA